ncbi:MAG: VanW family protein [Eggerthellaceae bacterium]|nr:VanW family protein [Eggerthellaceae bacterium]
MTVGQTETANGSVFQKLSGLTGMFGSVGRKGAWRSRSGDYSQQNGPGISMLLSDEPMSTRRGIGDVALRTLMAVLTFIASLLASLLKLIVDACKRSKLVLAAFIVAALLVLGGGFDNLSHMGKVYDHVMVGEINAGGMTKDQLSGVLVQHYGTRLVASGVKVYESEEALANHEQNPHDTGELSVEEQAAQTVNWYADKDSLQAYIDYNDIIDQAMDAGRSGVLDRLGLLIFKRTIPVDINYNEACIEALASQMDLAVGYPFVNSQITVDSGQASASESSDGMMVDREELKRNLTDQFLSSNAEGREFYVVAVETPAQITTEKGQDAANRANAAIANGVTFQYGETVWSVDSATMGTWLDTNIVKDENGDCTLSVYVDPLKAQLDISDYAKPNFEGNTETIEFKQDGDDILVLLESDGTMPQISSAISHLNDMVFGEGADVSQTPNVVIQSTDVPSQMRLNEALNAGVISVIGEYTTEYTPGAAERNHNIHLAADLLDNSIAKANGGIWSFNETAGECNEEKGFQAAGSIVGSQLTDEIGGGICQVGTTVFNAVYEVGLPIVERHNHSMYISSYPAGRDAAISWPDLDLQWKNETSSDILLKTSYTDSSLTVTLYGISPGYTVTTETGSWEQGATYNTVYLYDEEYAAGYSYVRSYGSDGQSISVTRTVTDRSGDVVHEDTFVSVYEPTNEVIVRGGTAADWPAG